MGGSRKRGAATAATPRGRPPARFVSIYQGGGPLDHTIYNITSAGVAAALSRTSPPSQRSPPPGSTGDGRSHSLPALVVSFSAGHQLATELAAEPWTAAAAAASAARVDCGKSTVRNLACRRGGGGGWPAAARSRRVPLTGRLWPCPADPPAAAASTEATLL